MARDTFSKSPFPLSAGEQLCDEQYTIQRHLGGGKYAEVYQAIDQRIAATEGGDPRVAIKIPREKYWKDLEATARLKREGKLQRTDYLGRHNKIVGVLKTEVLSLSSQKTSATSVPILIMEYVEHITLSEYLQRNNGVAPLNETFLVILHQLGNALDWIHAHKPGVIHRDLAPHNILLRCNSSEEGGQLLPRRDDFVQLTDFGLAFVETERRITQDEYERKRIAANLRYASPEILYGEIPTAQDDIYSLGALIFKMLSGRLAFPCNHLHTEEELWEYARLVDETPVIFPSPESIPEAVQDIVIKAMAKKRHERYERAREMTEALQDALHEWDRFQSTARASLPSTVPVSPPENPTSEQKSSSTQPDTTQQKEKVTLEQARPEQVSSTSSSQPLLIRGVKKVSGCLVRFIGLTMLLGLGLIFVSALLISALTKNWPARNNATSSPQAQLTPISTANTHATTVPPATDDPTADVSLTSPTPTNQPILTEAPQPTTQSTNSNLSPDMLAVQAEHVDFAYVKNETPQRFMGISTRDEESDFSLFQANNSLEEPAWSPNNDLLAYVSTRDGLPGVYVTDGLTTRSLSPPGVEEHWPTWSQDGKSLLVATHEDGTSHLTRIELESGAHEPLTGPYFNAWAPAWSPTEEYIAFVSDMEGKPDVYLLSLRDLDRPPVNVSQSGNVKQEAPAWAPDGKWLIYATTEGLRWVSIENAEPGTPYEFTNNTHDRSPCFLNERQILFERTSAAGTVSIFKGRLGNATPQRIVDHATWPTCKP